MKARSKLGEKAIFIQLFGCQKRGLPPKSRPTFHGAPNKGSVAQSVEQRIENPRVGGSIPSRATTPLSGYFHRAGL